MKKILCLAVLICFIAVNAYANVAELAVSGSGEITASAIINTGSCYITPLTVITDGTNAATVILYDNTAASGTKIAEFVIPGGDRQGGRNWVFPRYCTTGIYAAISGTGASCIVEYKTR